MDKTIKKIRTLYFKWQEKTMKDKVFDDIRPFDVHVLSGAYLATLIQEHYPFKDDDEIFAASRVFHSDPYTLTSGDIGVNKEGDMFVYSGEYWKKMEVPNEQI